MCNLMVSCAMRLCQITHRQASQQLPEDPGAKLAPTLICQQAASIIPIMMVAMRRNIPLKAAALKTKACAPGKALNVSVLNPKMSEHPSQATRLCLGICFL